MSTPESKPGEMPTLNMDIITVTRMLTDDGFVIDINHDGLDEDQAIAILMRAATYLSSMDGDDEDDDWMED